jgi:hypothetical protein
MSDPNWISATNARHPVTILSRIRAVFDVEASSRSTHFCGVVERRSKRLLHATANDSWAGARRDAASRAKYNPPPSHRLTATLAGASVLTSRAA